MGLVVAKCSVSCQPSSFKLHHFGGCLLSAKFSSHLSSGDEKCTGKEVMVLLRQDILRCAANKQAIRLGHDVQRSAGAAPHTSEHRGLLCFIHTKRVCPCAGGIMNG